MKLIKNCAWAALGVVLALSLLGGPSATRGETPVRWPVQGVETTERYLVVANTTGAFARLIREARAASVPIESLLAPVRAFAVKLTPQAAGDLRVQSGVAAVMRDSVIALDDPWRSTAGDETTPRDPVFLDLSSLASDFNGGGRAGQDPAYGLGLQWDHERMRVPEAHRVTEGRREVLVAIVDTGVDYDHAELQGRVRRVINIVGPDGICLDEVGLGESDLAGNFGTAINQDFNGHGTWLAGAVAANKDGKGVNGVAPGVSILSVKVLGWCGFGHLSDILEGILAAVEARAQIINLSLGGYLAPDDRASVNLVNQVTGYARARGSLIVAAAGNEHMRIGPGGKVLSHAALNGPGEAPEVLQGWYNVPAGSTGVLAVAATGNFVGAASQSCIPADVETADAVCKPSTDAHQPFGAGRRDQLTYYSNYGPRIDVAAPGGARKFNLPLADRGGTPGFPFTDADGTIVFEVFGITSNYAVDVPVFFVDDPGFHTFQAYTAIQGTSMATPNAAGVAALALSAQPGPLGLPGALFAHIKGSARRLSNNATPGLSASDTSPGDLTGVPCTGGYCHLGGTAIKAADAFGAGMVDALNAVSGPGAPIPSFAPFPIGLR